MLSDAKSDARSARVPTVAVYSPREENSDSVVRMHMYTANKDELLSPPLTPWPGAKISDYVQVRHTAVLSQNCSRGSLETCLLVWFTEECMDDRPMTILSRRLGLKTVDGAPVQGPVVVCTFGSVENKRSLDYGPASPVIHGAGSWVHVPTLGECVSQTPVAQRRAYLVRNQEL